MYYNFKEKDLNKYIYRIISLERLLGLFATEKNTLVKPELWEDTFENFILRSKVRQKSGEISEYNIHERMYGQCWTLHKSSDAMWRIYSPNKDGLRIRTKVKDLLECFYQVHERLPEAKCCIGKVEYLTDKELQDRANNTFDEGGGISVESIFKSLLIKRKAFEHECEVRLLYDAWDEENTDKKLFSYNVDVHDLVSQIMVDPRRSYSEFKTIKLIIEKATGYEGSIKRSLLYSLPKERAVSVKDVSGRT